ncbi:MAG: hypothetical protein WC694_02265 [Candidatus Paceibacterota bacterium]|jgi:hypothetical protein
MDINIFKLIGIVGLLLISVGLLLKNRKHQNILYIVGGGCLEIYSIYLKDTIFAILQIIFILSAVYDLIKIRKSI